MATSTKAMNHDRIQTKKKIRLNPTLMETKTNETMKVVTKLIITENLISLVEGICNKGRLFYSKQKSVSVIYIQFHEPFVSL